MSASNACWGPLPFWAAARAWCAAVECVASPRYPRELRPLCQYYLADVTEEELQALHEEAVRRANWTLPGDGHEHFLPPRSPDLYPDGLTWDTSVSTHLARRDDGWYVSIEGEHAQRVEAAREVLAAIPLCRTSCGHTYWRHPAIPADDEEIKTAAAMTVTPDVIWPGLAPAPDHGTRHRGYSDS